jgi:hypothetical protein
MLLGPWHINRGLIQGPIICLDYGVDCYLLITRLMLPANVFLSYKHIYSCVCLIHLTLFNAIFLDSLLCLSKYETILFM